MTFISLKEESAIIGLGIVIMIVSGALLNYLNNPIWINIFLGTIVIVGLCTLFFYLLFLWDFVELRQNYKILELERELERLKKE